MTAPESTPLPKTGRLSLAGIPLRLHYSLGFAILWVLLDARITPSSPSAVMGLTAGLLLSFMVHELAHILVARRFRWTAAEVQLTILGGIHRYQQPPAKRQHELITAWAGPSSSLAIAAVFKMLPLLSRDDAGWSRTCLILFAANVVWAAVNMLPLFPFDGGRMLRAWMERRIGRFDATRRIVQFGRWAALGLAGWGLVRGYWGALILAWFMHALARDELRRVQWETNGRPASAFEMLWRMTHQRRTPPTERSVDVEVGPPPYQR